MSRELYHSNCPSCGSDISQVREILESGDFTFCPRCQFPLSLVARKYRLLRQLGEGGFGKVYLAEHVWLDVDRERVIKVIKSEALKQPGMEKRFRREVQTTSSVSRENEHIVRVYDDFGEEKKLGYFYVMEYLQGITLEEFLLELDDVPGVDLALHIFRQICEAMEVAHRKGIIHRDLKPSNIFLIQRKDDPYFVKIFDFGVAKPVDWERSLQLTQSPVGTPAYMSPEQCRNKDVDARTDLYSLGIILYELLVGQTPFLDPADPPTMPELIRRHISAMPPPFLDLWPDHPFPAALEEAVMTAIEKRPEDRYASVGEFVDALKRAMEGTAHSAAFAMLSDLESHEESAFQGDISFVQRQNPSGGELMLAPHLRLVSSHPSALNAQVGASDALFTPLPSSVSQPPNKAVSSSDNIQYAEASVDYTPPSGDSLRPPSSNDAILFPPIAASHDLPIPSSEELAAALSSSERNKIRLRDPALQHLLTSLEAPLDALQDEEEVPTYVMEPLAIPAYLREENSRLEDLQDSTSSSDVLLAQVDLEADPLAWQEEIRSASKPLSSPMETAEKLRERKAVPVRSLHPSSPSLEEAVAATPQKQGPPTKSVGISWVGIAMIFLSGVVATVLLLQFWLAYQGESLLGRLAKLRGQTTQDSGGSVKKALSRLSSTEQRDAIKPNLSPSVGSPIGKKSASVHPPAATLSSPTAPTPIQSPIPSENTDAADAADANPDTQKAAPPARSNESPQNPASPPDRTQQAKEEEGKDEEGDEPAVRAPQRPRKRYRKPRKRRTLPIRRSTEPTETTEPAPRREEAPTPRREEAPTPRREEAPTPRREEAPAPRRLPAPVVRPVSAIATLRITTQPAGVTVLVDKKPRGKTPLTLRIPQGKSVSIQLKKTGFVSQQFRWTADQNKTHRAKMIEDLF